MLGAFIRQTQTSRPDVAIRALMGFLLRDNSVNKIILGFVFQENGLFEAIKFSITQIVYLQVPQYTQFRQINLRPFRPPSGRFRNRRNNDQTDERQ